MKEEIIEYAEKKKVVYKGQQIQISQAHDPSDVFWENLHINSKERFKRELISFFVQLTLILLSLLVVFLLGQSQKDQAGSGNNGNVQLISYMISIFITVSNSILSITAQLLTIYQRLETKTKFNVSIAKFISVSLFLNSSVIPIVLQVMVYASGYLRRIYENGGLLQNQNSLLLINVISPSLTQMLDIPKMTKLVKRWHYEKNKEKSVLTQSQLNELYEDPEFEISMRYAVAINTVFSCGFYSPILPIGLIWGILSLLLQYYTSKYSLLRRRVVKTSMSSELSLEMTEQLEYFLPIFSVRQIYLYNIYNKYICKFFILCNND